MNAALIIPELGQLAMILAICFAVVQASVPLLGAWRGDSLWMSLARPAAWGQFAFLVFAFACLTHAFMTDNFSVAYVASNSNSALPWYYKFSAVWGAHEGSLLLWALILGGWTFAVSVFSRQLPQVMLARVLAVMGMISVGFLSFLIITSNPFQRLLPQVPTDGRDLNPLLQDFGLIVHPPMLYMGYVGFSVAFAFAIAALLGGWIYGWSWMDPFTGIVGAILVGLWAKGLILDTSRVLLDREMDHPVVDEIRQVIERAPETTDEKIIDLHVWRVGRGKYSCSVVVVTQNQDVTPDTLRRRLSVHEEVVHSTIEIHHI